MTDLWIGDPSDPVLEGASDVTRAMTLATMTGLVVSVAAIAVINRLGAW